MSTPGDPLGNCERGIDLKETSRRLTSLGIASKMGEGRNETAVSWRKRGVLTQGFLRSDDGLVKATKLNQGQPYPTKRQV